MFTMGGRLPQRPRRIGYAFFMFIRYRPAKHTVSSSNIFTFILIYTRPGATSPPAIFDARFFYLKQLSAVFACTIHPNCGFGKFTNRISLLHSSVAYKYTVIQQNQCAIFQSRQLFPTRRISYNLQFQTALQFSRCEEFDFYVCPPIKQCHAPQTFPMSRIGC